MHSCRLTVTFSHTVKIKNQGKTKSKGEFYHTLILTFMILTHTHTYTHTHTHTHTHARTHTHTHTVPPPPLHPTLSEESIAQALQRLTQRQKMRRHAASSMPRRPVLAQTCLQKDKSIHNSKASPGEQGNEMTENQRDSQFLKHGNLCTSQGPGVKPRSPCLHGTSRHTEPTDLQLRIQTHNRAIAHHVIVQHHVSNSPLHMYSSEFQ